MWGNGSAGEGFWLQESCAAGRQQCVAPNGVRVVTGPPGQAELMHENYSGAPPPVRLVTIVKAGRTNAECKCAHVGDLARCGARDR